MRLREDLLRGVVERERWLVRVVEREYLLLRSSLRVASLMLNWMVTDHRRGCCLSREVHILTMMCRGLSAGLLRESRMLQDGFLMKGLVWTRESRSLTKKSFILRDGFSRDGLVRDSRIMSLR